MKSKESGQCPAIGRVRNVAGTASALVVIVPLLSGGCGGREAELSRFSPSASKARESLDLALTAWQRGELSGKKGEGTRRVELVDTSHKRGQKLESYEIISEATGDTPKRFSVRLKLQNPPQEIEVQYVVVGNDPIWVFHENDYARSQGM
jgi:hypothetical protein